MYFASLTLLALSRLSFPASRRAPQGVTVTGPGGKHQTSTRNDTLNFIYFLLNFRRPFHYIRLFTVYILSSLKSIHLMVKK
jgi:hypothetical protein